LETNSSALQDGSFSSGEITQPVLPQTSSTNLGHQAVGRHGSDTGRDAQELGSQIFEICGLCFCIQDFYGKLGFECPSGGESHAWYDP